ncbi:hypothetical protein LUZ60_008130 [Juncus effusus]|nr:hypothetical protein LUZ60_008130 [Juncus effusus]
MGSRATIFLSCLVFVMILQANALQVGYYNCPTECPAAESIVQGVVESYVRKDPGLGAGLIRMFFHDCFVRGCDASVLLDNSTSNPNTEKNSIPNNPSLRGFEVIDAAKEALESACPGKVSCADIIAFAARDASYVLGNISYDIPSGRYDGKISKSTEALLSLPPHFFNLTQLIGIFAKNNLSVVDLVTLSGAHSIGRSHCSSFTSRLYPTIDPTMDQDFALFLRGKCPDTSSTTNAVDGVVPQDFVTPNEFDSQYYDNVQARKALFFSDWSLLTSPETLQLVNDYSTVPGLFEESFGKSMVNMGNLVLLDETEGEIRKSCRAVNY